jgi:bud emergence protein 1
MFLYKEKASKGLKRLTTSKTKISNPHPVESTSPKKIIKALYDYKAKSNKELSFRAGDFFHVMSRENDLEWFEACNPSSYLKGLVPVPFFQIVQDKEKKTKNTGFAESKRVVLH